MVEVSLLELVSIPNTRPVWPEQFRDLVATCEANPDERTTFGVVADWCDEHGESEYGRAWRWLSKRPCVKDESGNYVSGVEVVCRKEYGAYPDWSLRGLPRSVAIFEDLRDVTTLVGRVAGLARRLIEIDQELQA